MTRQEINDWFDAGQGRSMVSKREDGQWVVLIVDGEGHFAEGKAEDDEEALSQHSIVHVAGQYDGIHDLVREEERRYLEVHCRGS